MVRTQKKKKIIIKLNTWNSHICNILWKEGRGMYWRFPGTGTMIGREEHSSAQSGQELVGGRCCWPTAPSLLQGVWKNDFPTAPMAFQKCHGWALRGLGYVCTQGTPWRISYCPDSKDFNGDPCPRHEENESSCTLKEREVSWKLSFNIIHLT